MFRFYFLFALSVVFILFISTAFSGNRLFLFLFSLGLIFLSLIFAIYRLELRRSDLKKALKHLLKKDPSA